MEYIADSTLFALNTSVTFFYEFLLFFYYNFLLQILIVVKISLTLLKKRPGFF